MKDLKKINVIDLTSEELQVIQGGALPYSPPSYSVTGLRAALEFASGFIDRFTMFSQ